jgi:hypothetical protein
MGHKDIRPNLKRMCVLQGGIGVPHAKSLWRVSADSLEECFCCPEIRLINDIYISIKNITLQ